MDIIVSSEAEADLEEIGDYIAQDNPHRAIAFIDEIRDRFEEIRRSPVLGTSWTVELGVTQAVCSADDSQPSVSSRCARGTIWRDWSVAGDV